MFWVFVVVMVVIMVLVLVEGTMCAALGVVCFYLFSSCMFDGGLLVVWGLVDIDV